MKIRRCYEFSFRCILQTYAISVLLLSPYRFRGIVGSSYPRTLAHIIHSNHTLHVPLGIAISRGGFHCSRKGRKKEVIDYEP